MAGLLSVDNIMIFGLIGGVGAYFANIAGFKDWVDAQIDGLSGNNGGNGNGNGNGTDPCAADPTAPGCTGTGGGLTCDDPTCTSECCKCKCKDRASCPEGVCCDKCKSECPAQCAGGATGLEYAPEIDYPISLPDYYSAGSMF